MQVTRLGLRNWKGITETTELGPLNLLIGRNGTGKSARLEALRWAVQGYTSLGKTSESAAALVGHKGGAVTIEIDDGFAWTRTIAIEPKTGAVKTAIEIAGHEGLGVREADALVAQHCGDFAPMFRLGAFLELSADKQRDMVLSLCGAAVGGSAEDVIDMAALEYLKAELGEGTVDIVATAARDRAAHAAVFNECVSHLDKASREALLAILPTLRDALTGQEDTAGAIAVALDRIRSIRNSAKQDRDHAQQAARKLQEQKNDITVVAASEAKLQKQLDTLDTERGELREQIANQRGREDSLASLHVAHTQAQARLTRLQEEFATLHTKSLQTTADADALDATAESILAGTPDVPAMPELSAQRTHAQHAANGAERAMLTTARALGHADDVIQRCEAELTTAESDDWYQLDQAIKRLLEQVDPIALASVTESTAWSQVVAIVSANTCADSVSRYRQALAEAVAKREKVRGRHLKNQALHQEAKGALARVETRYQEAISSQERIGKTRAEAVQRAAQLQREAIAIRDAIERHDAECARLQEAITEATTALTEAERQHAILRSAGGFVPLEQLDARLAAIDDDRSSLIGKVQERKRAATLEAELMRCIASAEQEATAYEVAKGLDAAMKNVRESIMESLIAPLIQRITEYLKQANGATAYCRLETPKGKPIFDLGWERNMQRRSYAAMSGGEQGLFGVALARALVDLADPPLRLLLIEAGALDHDALSLALQALAGCHVDGWTALVATHVEGWRLDGIHDRWNVHATDASTIDITSAMGI